MASNQKTLLSLCRQVDPDVAAVENILTKKFGAPGWYKLYADKERSPEFLGNSYGQCISNLERSVQPVNEIDEEEQAASVSELMSLQISEAQQHAVNMILDAAKRKKAVTVLKGYAGTGKTTVVQRAAVEARLRGLRISYCAPTNQAVKVLRNKMPTETCSTIHVLLGLALKNEYGRKVLVKANSSQMKYFNAIVIDEASMLGEELMKRIYDEFDESGHTSIIFVGDPKQLNPVGEEQSIAFDVSNGCELNEIVRQAEGNPILDATKRLRRMREFAFDKLRFTEDAQADIGLFRLRKSEVNHLVEELFLSNEFKKDNDYIRILCWTNEKVSKFNNQIHELIYGKTDTPYVVGERIIAKEPLADGVVKNSDECEVISIESSNYGGFDCWDLEIKNEAGFIIPCAVIKDEVKTEYAEKLEKLAEDQKWDSFYTLYDHFSEIQHVYAMTCHRSQGSTFDNVIVDASDILRNSANDEALRMLYVACSRPRYRAWLT